MQREKEQGGAGTATACAASGPDSCPAARRQLSRTRRTEERKRSPIPVILIVDSSTGIRNEEELYSRHLIG